MKLIAVATIVALASAFLAQAQDNTRCPTISSCPCTGHAAGLVCGINLPDLRCINGDVYQCNSNGKTCNFGPRASCQDCGELSC
ncbi:hypothetical protein BD779DRAFT_1650208 [Infundibulicybe gibba]|nr:hypothetical protein BD779DRAFT_1650208 [Infundibulicybe gibba]